MLDATDHMPQIIFVRCAVDVCEPCTGVARQADFVSWLASLLLGSLYPGAPFQRKYMALSLLNLLLQTQAASPQLTVLWHGEPLPDSNAAEQSPERQNIDSDTRLASVLLGTHYTSGLSKGLAMISCSPCSTSLCLLWGGAGVMCPACVACV